MNALGRYQIIREIARSNDIVYEAVDPAIGRRIALKELQIPPNLVGSAKRERVERFYREAKAAGALTHPNIVTIFEVGEESGRHFIAMEYLEGMNLQETLEIQGALPPKEAVDIASQILEALSYAHSKGIVHRDIKPANIQLTPGGRVKLTDFGIARIMHEASITQSGQIFGTPSYMSPEQVTGKDIDPRSDLFSLGVVLYEALTARKPFEGDSVVSITYNIMNSPPPRPQGLPEGLVAILNKAMEKDPSLRYQTAKDFQNALASNWQDAPAAPPPIFFPPGMGPQTIPPGGGFPGSSPSPFPTGPQQTGQPSGYPAGPLPGQAPGRQTTGMPPGGPVPRPYTPPRPRQPLLTAGQVGFLKSLTIAVILGASLLAAIMGVNKAYQNYEKQAADSRAESFITSGNNLFKQGKYADAIGQYNSALRMELSPQTQTRVKNAIATSYVSIAQNLMNQGSTQAAMQNLEQAIRIYPDSGDALYLLGVVNARSGQWVKAVDYWEQAVSRSPDSEGAKQARKSLQQYYFVQAENYERQGDAGAAIRLYQQVAELDSTSETGKAAQRQIERIMFR